MKLLIILLFSISIISCAHKPSKRSITQTDDVEMKNISSFDSIKVYKFEDKIGNDKEVTCYVAQKAPHGASAGIHCITSE